MQKTRLPAWAVLTLIALVAALLLGATYEMTKDPIAEQEVQKAVATRQELIPEAASFDELEAAEALKSLYVGNDENGEAIGYIATLDVTGFGGPVEIIVGMDTEGVISGIRVGGTEFSETPGLGAKAKEPAFTNQFEGLSAPLSLGKDLDAITAATITSNAVVRGVNTAADEVGKVAGFSAAAPANVGETAEGKFYSEVQGFAGPVYVEIGLDDAGAIADIVIGNDAFAETPGFGKKWQEPDNYNQFIGLSGTIEFGAGVDSITGATVTSNAVLKAVNQALAFSRSESVVADEPADVDASASATGAADTAAPAEEIVVGQLENGNYYSEVKGFAGPVYVEVALDENYAITAITIGDDRFAETEGFGEKAKGEAFWGQFIGLSEAKLGENVDAIAFATITSTAVQDAVNNAIAFAKGEITVPAATVGQLDNGNYYAEAQGFAGPVYVEVTLDENYAITAITIGDDRFAETEGFGEKAKGKDFRDQFIGKSEVKLGENVDAIAFATITSTAVQDAVNEAIAFAKGETTEEPATVGQLENGNYYAEAQGFAGPVYVEVTLDENYAITAITIGDDRFAETEGFGEKAKGKDFRDQFIGKSEVKLGENVDAIAFATITSTAVQDAVNEAIAFAKGGASEESTEEPATVGQLENGNYYAEAQGFAGPVYVEVTLDENYAITAITIGDDRFAETEGFGEKAKGKDFRDQFIGKSEVKLGENVDAIAFATITSTAVQDAVNEAIAFAKGGASEESTEETADVDASASATATTEETTEEAAAPTVGQLENGNYYAEAKGFAGPVYVEVTLDENYAITAITIGDDRFAETEGFGEKAKGEAFWGQFIGLTEAKLGENVDAIAFATITSTAVQDAVNEAIAFAKGGAAE